MDVRLLTNERPLLVWYERRKPDIFCIEAPAQPVQRRPSICGEKRILSPQSCALSPEKWILSPQSCLFPVFRLVNTGRP